MLQNCSRVRSRVLFRSLAIEEKRLKEVGESCESESMEEEEECSVVTESGSKHYHPTQTAVSQR